MKTTTSRFYDARPFSREWADGDRKPMMTMIITFMLPLRLLVWPPQSLSHTLVLPQSHRIGLQLLIASLKLRYHMLRILKWA